jgi:hypothetical protein
VAVPPTWLAALAGFLLFRAFDIAKPWPVGWADRRVPGAAGVMLDDLIAGMLGVIQKLPDHVNKAIACYLNEARSRSAKFLDPVKQEDLEATDARMIADAQALFNTEMLACMAPLMLCLATKKGWDRVPCIIIAVACLASKFEYGDEPGGGAQEPSGGYVAPTKSRLGCSGQ